MVDYVKLITIGQSTVGKTSLTSSYCGEDVSPTHYTTVGVDFKATKTLINEVEYSVKMFDTAG
jgi:small GTP-binding protein